MGVAVDASGHVYVADSRNNKVRKIAPLVTVPAATITATSTDDVAKSVTTTANVAFAAPVASGLDGPSLITNFGDPFTLTPHYSGGTAVISYLPPFGISCPATGVATAPIVCDWPGSARTFVLTVTNAAGVSATTSVTVGLTGTTTNQ